MMQAIWSTFQAKAGTERDMSSAEYNLCCGWLDKSIPLPVVERAINDMTSKPRTLMACEWPVEDAFAYWFKAMGGL